MNAHPSYYAQFKQEWTVKALGDRFEAEARARREQRTLDSFGGMA
jgi:hypothetical protein